MDRSSTARSRWRTLAFAAVAVSLGLGLVEVALRLAGFGPPVLPPATENMVYQHSKFRPSQEFLWELVPGWKSRAGVSVSINTHGLRDREFPAAKPAGTLRVLCLGDSVTFGHRVDAAEPYPRRLEENLLAGQTGGSIQVINAGIPGYSTFQQRDWLEKKGWALEPDLVILSFVLNDVLERYNIQAAYGGDDTVFGIDTTLAINPVTRVLRRTAFHHTVKTLMLSRAERQEVYNVARLFDSTLSEPVSRAWAEVETGLAEMVAAARERQTPFLLVAFPFRFQLEQKLPPRPQQRLSRWAAAQGVDFLDLARFFFRAGAEDTLLDYCHPSPVGHRVAAAAIAAELRTRWPDLFRR